MLLSKAVQTFIKNSGRFTEGTYLNPQTHLESVIILDRNRSYLSELQLRRNLAYKILCRLSPTKK
jgi:hypothetical protein